MLETDQDSSYLRKERAVVFSYIVCLMGTLAREIFRRWSVMERGWPSETNAPHVDYAPEAYRVGMPWLVKVLQKILPPLSYSAKFGISDFLFGSLALGFLYLVAVDGYSTSPQKRVRRALMVMSVLAAMHFPLLWTLDWLRYITLPCAFYLACGTWLLLKLKQGSGWLILLLCLTLWQGFVRSDVAFIFGMAVMILSALGLLREIGSRRRIMMAGAAIMVIAGAVQVYLQFVAFPHLSYPPGTPVFMGRINLGRPYLTAFAVAMLPAALVYAGVLMKPRKSLRAVDWICLGAPLLYLPLWVVVGSIMEVRVFVPFFLLMVPAAAHVIEQTLVGTDGPALTRPIV